MFEITAIPLIEFLHGLPAEIVALLSLFSCYGAIIFLSKYGKESGLFIYTSIAMIACNLQVLKAAQFSFYNEPIALGTLVYASTFLASDVLTELYGANQARKSVYLSFAASILLLILMTMSLGFKPLELEQNSSHQHFNDAHQSLKFIFSPNAALLTASLTAYIISQLTDIFIFAKLKNITRNSYIWLRTFVSFLVASIIDSLIFNILAWRIFSPSPIDWYSLIFTYIIGAIIFQVIVGMFNIPAFYLLLKITRKAK